MFNIKIKTEHTQHAKPNKNKLKSKMQLTISIAYETWRFNAALTRALQYPYPEPNQPNSCACVVSCKWEFSCRLLFISITAPSR